MRPKYTLLSLSQTRFVCFTAAEHLNKAAHDRIRSLHITMPIPTKIAAVLYPYYIRSAPLWLTSRTCTSRHGAAGLWWPSAVVAFPRAIQRLTWNREAIQRSRAP
ncbi:hypothetical protein C8Q76DRAFT_713614 [Earliella scabrosa]|nr:hypothetical protein C8Q76DRAFT_713614 [Earliella scabrosa]